MKKLNKIIVQKIKCLPKEPGVYLFRDGDSRVVYVGKASILKNRVKSYFIGKNFDLKTNKLIEKIEDLEYIICGSEIEALLLESELIKRYKPRYNIELKDDKSYCYIKITKEKYPRVFVVRQVTGSRDTYLGPFVDSQTTKNALKVLRKIFPFCTCGTTKNGVCLYYHLGLCKGHDKEHINHEDYQKNINNLIDFLSNNKTKIIKKMEKQMIYFSKKKDYEKAADVRDKMFLLNSIRYMHIIESKRNLDMDKALFDLQKFLKVGKTLERIECYDISNISGKFAVGSMVVFEQGIAKKNDYRRFEIKNVKTINDFAMLQEVLKRRFTDLDNKRDPSFGKVPDLVIIDGGKGQLSSVYKELENLSLSIATISLAKKKEEVFCLNQEERIDKLVLPENSEIRYLLQRIRDEAHRFAITYHRNLRSQTLASSALDTIEGIGPVYKKRLINKFDTIDSIKSVSSEELTRIVGPKLADKIKKEL